MEIDVSVCGARCRGVIANSPWMRRSSLPNTTSSRTGPTLRHLTVHRPPGPGTGRCHLPKWLCHPHHAIPTQPSAPKVAQLSARRRLTSQHHSRQPTACISNRHQQAKIIVASLLPSPRTSSSSPPTPCSRSSTRSKRRRMRRRATCTRTSRRGFAGMLSAASHGQQGTIIITLAGENKDTSLKISSAVAPLGSKDDGEKKSSMDGKEGVKAMINSNVQSINNSLLLHSSCSGGDLGVHLKLKLSANSKSKSKSKSKDKQQCNVVDTSNKKNKSGSSKEKEEADTDAAKGSKPAAAGAANK